MLVYDSWGLLGGIFMNEVIASKARNNDHIHHVNGATIFFKLET